jgi:hypothetical protein
MIQKFGNKKFIELEFYDYTFKKLLIEKISKNYREYDFEIVKDVFILRGCKRNPDGKLKQR